MRFFTWIKSLFVYPQDEVRDIVELRERLRRGQHLDHSDRESLLRLTLNHLNRVGKFEIADNTQAWVNANRDKPRDCIAYCRDSDAFAIAGHGSTGWGFKTYDEARYALERRSSDDQDRWD